MCRSVGRLVLCLHHRTGATRPKGVEFFEQGSTRINPGVHIPPEATAVHGLTKDMLTGCPSFATLAQTIYDFADGCDLAGYNVRRLMVPMLTAEFQRCNMQFPTPGTKVADLMRIFHRHESRDLAGAVQFFLNRPHLEQHGALEDAVATVELLAEMVVRYDLPRDVAALEAYACGDDATLDGKFKWSKAGDGRDVILFNFGKYKGKKLQAVAAADPGYISWMRPRFAPDVVELLDKAAAGRLHDVRRPPRRKHQSSSKPTAHSVMRVLDVAHKLTSTAADQLAESVQKQQRGASREELPSALLNKVAEMTQLVNQMQLAVRGFRAAPGAVAAPGSSGAACSSSVSSSSSSSAALHTGSQQQGLEFQVQALLEQLTATNIQHVAPLTGVQSALQSRSVSLSSSPHPLQFSRLHHYFEFQEVPGRGRLAILNIGQHKGQPLLDVALLHPDYLDWMLRPETDFPAEVRELVVEAKAVAASGVRSSTLQHLLPRSTPLRDDHSSV